MFIETVLTVTFLIFLSEVGDKTNLVALSLMSKYQRPYEVAFGGILAITVTSIIGVLIGVVLGNTLPMTWVPILASIVFLVLGITSILEVRNKESEELEEMGKNNAVLEKGATIIIIQSFFVIFLAEIGDKSQLFIITGAIITQPIPLLLGAILGMSLVMILTALFGEAILSKFPEGKLSILTGLLFIIAGTWILIDVLFFH